MSKKDWIKCILRDDSRNIIKRIPDNSIDFILTDPPYNIGKHSTGNIPLPGRTPMNNDVADWDWVDFNPEEWIDDFIRILKPNGNLFIFTSYNQIGRWYDGLDHKFDTTNFMIWHKTNPAPKIFKAGFLNSCEMIFTCWNKGHTWNFISQAEMHNFFESPICMKPERLSNPKHPAQKPIALLKKLITIASNPDDIVFDPFMGVGSTGVAALQLGRKFIGVEINPEYFSAAKTRIEVEMAKKEDNKSIVEEPIIVYQQTLFDVTAFSKTDGDTDIFEEQIAQTESPKGKSVLVETGLKPIIKWAGGKEKELKYIIPNLPVNFDNYYEPFVGGGSVFMSIRAKKYFINDLSEELISLYRNIEAQDKSFFDYISQIDTTWSRTLIFFKKYTNLIDKYLEYRTDAIKETQLKEYISIFCEKYKDEIVSLLGVGFTMHHKILVAEMKKNLFRKMKRMKELELSKHLLPDKDLADNIETAIKGAFYMYYRHLYNDKTINSNGVLHSALFFFIRNYCYSGMFRYNDNGDFNVPYGGIAYNSKSLSNKISYYKSGRLRDHFKCANIDNMDFEKFLRLRDPKSNDFVFLDPPYDSEFSTYAKNEFGRDDQRRLADYMINECKAKWMLIIKNTDFIFDLYNKPGINISTFDKEYLVSFMNRNDKKVTHLLITNY